jgi:hypothetical protein
MITWAAIRLLASGALDGLLRGLSAAAKWLVSDWRNLFVTLFGLAALWQGWVIIPNLREDVAATEQLLTDTQLAHLGTISNFIDASAEAERQAEANVARVTAEQERITDATLADYRADRAALLARFDRLRAGAAAADPRRADPAGLPGAGNAPGRAAAPAGEDRLPSAGALSLDDALIASEQALQLNALIDWVEAQSAVRFAPEVQP